MWITDYREREGLELYQLQQRVNSYIHKMSNPIEATISGELIHMLEVDKNAVTHPRIANAIAIMCDATPEQRDMIVADVHKSKWFGPTENEKEWADEIRISCKKSESQQQELSNINIPIQQSQKSWEFTTNNNCDAQTTNHRKEVVKLDRTGNVVARYTSIKAAARSECHTSKDIILARCRRKIKKEFNSKDIEAKHSKGVPSYYTFRFAEEWDNMTREQQLMDINRTIIAKEDV